MQTSAARILVFFAAFLAGASAFSAGGFSPRVQLRTASRAPTFVALAGGVPARPLSAALGPRSALQLASRNAQSISGAQLVGRSSLWIPGVEEGLGGGGGGIARRSGGGGGGGGDDGEESEKGEIAALLTKYGLVASQLPKGAEALDAKMLGRFLQSYSNRFNRWLINIWPAWRDKMLADPEFAYKMMVEETVGLSLAMSGTVAARGKDILKELDFFLTDCAVGAVINFVIIWLLAPSVAKSAATVGATGLASTLAKLPPFALAEGKYSVAQRLGAGVYKGSVFGGCGFLGSVGGTALAYSLFQIRGLLNPSSSAKESKPMPNILANSLGWASFMFVSTNPRYQLINGFEQVMYKALPTAVSKGGSLVIRTGNNVIGGATWVMWARFIGLQKQADDGKNGKGKKADKKKDQKKGKK